MSNGQNELVPASIVKILFDQVQGAVDKNTEAVKESTKATSELVHVLMAKPTRDDLMEEILAHEKSCSERQANLSKNVDDVGDDEGDTGKVVLENRENIKETLKQVYNIKTKITVFITAISIILSILTISYIFVQKSNEVMIQNSINKAVELIVTTRPESWGSNTWPPIYIKRSEHDKLTKEQQSKLPTHIIVEDNPGVKK